MKGAKRNRHDDKKLRRKKHQEDEALRESVKFDVVSLLIENELQTKPQIGDFLKKYVKSIRAVVDYSKVMLYPVMQYSISKVFIDFIDGHQIISDFHAQPREYLLWDGLDEVPIKDKDEARIREFVQKLGEFQFIR